MQQIREGADQPPGRRRLERRPVRIPDDERAELYQLLNDYTEALDERLDDGLRALHRGAQQLMRQLAAEVWRAGGPTAGQNLRENVIAALAQDDTIKGLLAHTDERYQSLKVRLAEMEGAVRQLAEATRDAVRRVNKRAEAIDQALASAGPGSAEAVESAIGPLAERMGQLSAALGPIAEQMRAIEPMAQRMQALGASVQQLQGLAPITERLESLETFMQDVQEHQREDLKRFAERTASAMAEATRRIREGVAGDIQRLEGAVRSETAFAGASAESLREDLLAMSERTGEVLDAVRSDLAARIDGIERAQRGALEETARAQQERLDAFTARAAEGIAEVTRRLREELREILAGVTEGQAAAGRGLAAVSERLDGQQARLEAFTERAGQGLTQVSARIQEGFRLMIERSRREAGATARATAEQIAGAIEQLERRLDGIAERTGTVLDGVRRDVQERIAEGTRETKDETIHLVTQVVTRQAGQQARNLEAITQTLRHLLEAIQKAGREQATATERVLRAAAGRQEGLLTETLEMLRSAVEEVTTTYAKADPTPERAADAHAFSRRLRGVEQRLTQLSAELAGGTLS